MLSLEPQRPSARINLIGAFARHVCRALFFRLFRCRITGEVPAKGPYLLIANHQGWADPFVLIAMFPAEPRMYFFGDRKAVTHAWWKRLTIRLLGGMVLVDRGAAADRSAITGALDVVRSDAVLGLFPEGRVSRAEAQLAPFQRGTAYLALKAGVPVLPVWLRGTGELYLGRELTVKVGTLITPPTTEPTKEATVAFAQQLHEAVAALAEPWIEDPAVQKRWRWLTNVL